jgi:hypothetical protein
MLIRRARTSASRLARRLLILWPRVVSDIVLYSLVIYSVGCIVPTPLDQQAAATNYPPVFETSLVDPQFGPLPHNKTDSWLFKLSATDPNNDDVLFARLLFQDPDGTFSYATDVPMMKEASTDPTAVAHWHGQSPDSRWCLNFVPGRYFLYAFVADQSFIGSSEKSNGLEDSNHWELQCM